MTDLVVHEGSSQSVSIFNNNTSFEHAQRIAKMLCSSDLVPATYRGNIANTLVALEMANRIGASPLAVMQNMNVVHGKPSWSSTFIIASINTCGRFSPLRFTVTGEGDNMTCIASATDLSSNTKLEGPPVSIAMAKKEGWFNRSGSKWPNMPELMLRYRAAAFFGRLYAPEVMMGMHTAEEIQDAVVVTEQSIAPVAPTDAIQEIAEQAKQKKQRKSPKPAVEIQSQVTTEVPNADELM